MQRFESIAATLFGVVFLVLALAVAVETLTRKLFNVSLQGVDELGSYCLAIGGALSFAVALQARAHMRIDIVHDLLPRGLRVLLNVAAVLTLAICAGALVQMALTALSDSIAFHSAAQTPWATPLRYPQAVWLVALVVFGLFAAMQVVRVGLLLARGRMDKIDREFSPRGSKEELEDELKDIKTRGAAAVDFEMGSTK